MHRLTFTAVILLFHAPLIAQQPGSSIPPGIEAKLDLPYAATDNPRQRLDLFLPKERDAAKKLPVLVFIHGGAWQAGSKEQGRGQLMRFVREGKCAGVSVGYRLSQEAQWPAQIHDCKAAIRWLKAHAAEHGLDAERIVVWGSSAGGHLVAVLGTSAGVPEMDGKLGPHTDKDTRVNGVIDFFGPTDVSKMNAQRLPGTMDHDSPNAPEAKLLGAPVQTVPDKVKSANPLTYVDRTDPPFLMVHGEKDPLVPLGQSEILEAELKKAGVASELYTVKGGQHGGFQDSEVPKKVEAFLKARFENAKATSAAAP
jgi:acetyl esterase/lipase